MGAGRLGEELFLKKKNLKKRDGGRVWRKGKGGKGGGRGGGSVRKFLTELRSNL